MWPAEQRLSCIRPSLYRLRKTNLYRRNVEVVEWSLVASVEIPIGTFLGFYTGHHSNETHESLYAAKINNTNVYPFANESNITLKERNIRPFANMNEPKVDDAANCCMIYQDFKHDEVDGVNNILNSESARFFRGLACFACRDIKKDEELTWYYGRSYEANRQKQGYEVGRQCDAIVDDLHFVASNSQAVLTVMPKVTYKCLIPVFGLQKSGRFPVQKKRKKRNESDESSEKSSSGSGHEDKYQPISEDRETRRLRRAQRVT